MINLIMSEFNTARVNCGGGNLKKYSRLDPTLMTFKRYFENFKLTIYTNIPTKELEIDYSDVDIVHVPLISDPQHPRAAWRSSSYWKIIGMLKSQNAIAIGVDSDFYIMSKDVQTIVPLTNNFGVCFPMNPRYIVKVDTLIGADSDKQLLDPTNGTGFAVNNGILTLNTKNEKAKKFLTSYANRRKNEGRGTISLWRTIWEFGSYFHPYLLPIQWCVCKKHIGVGNEIILHLGHQEVINFYADILK
jgi:hypothetical protein